MFLQHRHVPMDTLWTPIYVPSLSAGRVNEMKTVSEKDCLFLVRHITHIQELFVLKKDAAPFASTNHPTLAPLSDLSGGWKAGAIDPGHISIVQPQDSQHFSEKEAAFPSYHVDSKALAFPHRHVPIGLPLLSSCLKISIHVLRDDALCCLCNSWKF